MDNSILPILPAIHATILSIIFAVLIVYFFYSYETVGNLKEQLNDLRTRVAQTMYNQPSSPLNSSELEEYFKDNKLNHMNIQNKLWELSSVMDNIEIIKIVPPHPSMGENYVEETITEYSEHLLKIITVLTYIYPYCERPKNANGTPAGISNIKRKDFTPEWERDLRSINFYLSWSWRTRGEEITKLISEYDAILAKKQRLRLNFSQFVADFFAQVQFIQSQIIPELSEKSYKLNFFENKFKIKTHLIQAFLMAIFISVFGIFLPLFIHLYFKPPYIKQIELGLLIITVLPYLSILLYYLKKTLELKFR